MSELEILQEKYNDLAIRYMNLYYAGLKAIDMVCEHLDKSDPVRKLEIGHESYNYLFEKYNEG